MSPPYATEKSAQRRCRRATVSQHWLKFFFTVLRKQVDGFPTLRTEKLLKWTPKNDKISKLPEFNQLDFLVHSLPLPIISEKSTHTFWAILPTRRQTNTDEGSITTPGYHLPQRDPRDAPPDAYRGRDVRTTEVDTQYDKLDRVVSRRSQALPSWLTTNASLSHWASTFVELSLQYVATIDVQWRYLKVHSLVQLKVPKEWSLILEYLRRVGANRGPGASTTKRLPQKQ